MGFTEIFLRKDASNIRKEDIEQFIARKVEENLNLEYKNIQAYSDFSELSKDISAFANSAGGLLLLGVSEKEIKSEKTIKILPKEVTWGSEYLSKEQLEDNLLGKIHPRIDELKIIPIREGNGSLRIIFLIDIPQSDSAPHMASDYRYYKRLNFQRVPMEHYEVADFFGRRRKPILNLFIEITEVKIENDKYTFTLRFFLQNIGKAIARHASFSASFVNVDIVGSRDVQRIDELRDGVPSIQFGEHFSVFYPTPNLRTRIGEVSLKVRDNNQPIVVSYDLIAEDADLIKRTSILNISSLNQAMEMLKMGQKPSVD